MKVCYNLFNMKNTAVALGRFDGIHNGHIKLINNVVEIAKNQGLTSVVYTFLQKPANFITTNTKRIEILSELGVDKTIFADFNSVLQNTSPQAFLQNFAQCKNITVGYNYHFGKGAMGDVELLKSFANKENVDLNIIPKVDNASSSAVRQLIQNGDVAMANKMLSREFSVKGLVEEGDMIGRTIGFPTANISLREGQVKPSDGVYLTKTVYKQSQFVSITNVGGKPTVRPGVSRIETHIIGMEEDLYFKEIEIYFVEKIRDIVKFSSLEQLKNQLKKDKEYANDYKRVK